VGEPEFGQAASYTSNSDRRRLRDEIVEKIQSIIGTKRRDHWLDIFRDARIPAGPINRIDEVAADPELRRRGFFYAVPRGDAQIPQVGLGIHVDGNSHTFRKPPPRLGEDSQDVLRAWLDIEADTLRQLKEDGIV
ncbi:CoA transferase, partial [Staphylococcus aureus]